MGISSELLGTIARGYCAPENSKKVFDPDLCKAIAKEVQKYLIKNYGDATVKAVYLINTKSAKL